MLVDLKNRNHLAARLTQYFAMVWLLSTFLFMFVWSPWTFAADFEALKAGVVSIASQFDNGVRKVGTGFVIRLEKNEAYVITATHVVEEKDVPIPQITVTFYPDKLRGQAAEINKMQRIEDNPRGLSVLRVKGTLPDGIAVLSWGVSDSLSGGESVDFVGFPRFVDTPWAVTSGRVSGWKGEYLTLSGTVDEGNSGGPIFLDGKVVGMVMENQGPFSYAVPASRVGLLAKNWGIIPQWPPREDTPPAASQPIPPTGPGLAAVTIHCNVPDAQVFFDDERMGDTRDGALIINNIIPDEYEIVVRKEGFRPWSETIELLPGESRSLTATLQEGRAFNIAGTWRIPGNPTVSYVFEQTGTQVVMQELTVNLYGVPTVTAEGAGQLEGNGIKVFFTTIRMTSGMSQAVISDDGNSMVGSVQDFSSGATLPITLVRSSP